MGEGDGGGDFRKINVDNLVVFGVRVGFISVEGAVNPAVYVFEGHFVHIEDAVFGSGFNGHVGHAEPVVHGEIL